VLLPGIVRTQIGTLPVIAPVRLWRGILPLFFTGLPEKIAVYPVARPCQRNQRNGGERQKRGGFPAPALFQFVDGGLYRIVLFIVLRGEKRRFPPGTGFALKRGNIVIRCAGEARAHQVQDAGVRRSSA
jgi:hypothetical protein